MKRLRFPIPVGDKQLNDHEGQDEAMMIVENLKQEGKKSECMYFNNLK